MPSKLAVEMAIYSLTGNALGFASLLIALALSPALVSFAGFPRVTTVEPDTGKVGDIVTAKGENLDKSSVSEVYLTDGSHDMKVQIAQQTAAEVTFKVPSNLKAGQYHILVLTADKKSLVEQPVIFTVERPWRCPIGTRNQARILELLIKPWKAQESAQE